MRKTLLLALLIFAVPAQAASDLPRLKAEAARITITRDDFGIAHIKGKTDADAVFGAVYAQAEDDFARVEMNYLVALGRKAEAEGEGALWEDLRQRLFIDPRMLQANYQRSPAWLKKLMSAWADGLNFYLVTHPATKPKVLTHFEPWMALSFTEGSIGGDIESVDIPALAAFHGKTKVTMHNSHEDELSASNGIAISPSKTLNGHALLLINPHTSLFFRSELQLTSEEGLNAYGAVTWGQFFIYQGFNAGIGWMHTSAHVDNIDEFAEIIKDEKGKLSYKYGAHWFPVTAKTITLRMKTADGLRERNFTAYFTKHGPVVRAEKDKWIAVSLMNKPIAALEQSFLRTKSKNATEFLQIAEAKANSSNNTVFADSEGHIGFVVPQFVPGRDDRFDYTKPVDGSDPATDWKGLLPLAKLPQAIDPANGWVVNTNNWPYSAAGAGSPKASDFPKYMDTAGENYRGVHALSLLQPERKWSVDDLRAAAYDSDMPAFAKLLPSLVQAWESLDAANSLKAKLAEPIALLKAWDHRWSAQSVETTLAVLWGDELRAQPGMPATPVSLGEMDQLDAAPARAKLTALAAVMDRLSKDFGTWHVAWGEMNRYQRAADNAFDDTKPSIAIPFTASRWGSLASFAARRWPGTNRYYGTSGNSFVAAVEFGPKVKAVAVMAGGANSNPASPHFSDQAARYAAGDLRPVYFYPEDLKSHTERVYHPGE